MVYNFNNKAILDALLEYYGINREIEESDKSNTVKNLLNRFTKENLNYFTHVAPWLKNLVPKLEGDTQELRQPSTLQALSIARIVRSRTELLFKLFSSAKNGDLEAVKYLVERAEVDVNAQDMFEFTSLMFAAASGHLDVVKYLVKEAKVDVNAGNEFGNTPLIFAAEDGHLDVVKYLVKEAKANVNAKNEFGGTALMFAAKNGHLGIVKCLVEAKADVNTQDRKGNTPLMLAAQRGDLGIVKCLVEAKADANTKNYYGATALTRTTQDVRKYLKNHVRKINEIELRKERVCISVCGAVGFITGFAVAYNTQAAIATCATSAVTGLLLGAVVGYLAIKVKREKREDPDIAVVTALKNILTIQWSTWPTVC
ncbi:ankyrin repeat domain-containing protein [Wolbachia endosymbiont (group B) of Ischnura elegans]|uniref:ankyrin repeat domain-containing protein n=1 Tax=Wolbachia endosymbiont (group B) of Ischnura elegans TaxID=2954021 RepID=UPI0022320062|nr:ankyrin repeat domain-containing protein [Wolbachia endosymbiont (group B) of Ischnura elegans]